MNTTNKFYEENAAAYFSQTINTPMSYDRFLAYLAPRSTIMDLGCGSGRDAKHFMEQGYQVHALDSSVALGQLVSTTLTIPVTISTIEEWAPAKKYDGIWSCASLLHLEWSEIKSFFARLPHFLEQNGVIFVSVKSGIETGFDEKGRYFTNFTEEMVEEILTLVPQLALEELWYSGDNLNRDGFKWMNFIIKLK